MSKQFRLVFIIVLVFLAACGGSGDQGGETPPTAPPATTAPAAVPTPEPTLPPSNVVQSLEDVRKAVIQIEAEGSFVDPQVGLRLNTAGRGSGFIIDESGLAVTNNHVVTGAALIKVFMDGQDKPLNARILGVSECSDLALIDIEGEGYPYMEWYQGSMDVGLDVYAAGFPLGDPEYTLTRGIISKASANGETNWASVDSVIQHDATINPGNSGGPLVTGDGQVVGINYAGASEVNQYFSITREEALKVIDLLKEGNDVTSIGVNGTAVLDQENNISGIWVSSVKSGSPADAAGLEGGDIITTLEGLVLATDGSMADYCDILRTHNPGDTMDIEVLRFDSEEYLSGQLNGRELEVKFSFAQNLAEDVPNEPPASSGETGYSEYVAITDDSGLLHVEVPPEWSAIDGSEWVVGDSSIGASVTAAPDLDGFLNGWTTPGVFFGASVSLLDDFDEQGVLDAFDFSDSCENGGRNEYSDPAYSGFYDIWSNCDNTGNLMLVLSVVPDDRSYIALVTIQAMTDADLQVLDHILSTFIVSE